jgi:hypothetical protein
MGATFSNSSEFQPVPMPTITRPPESWSSVATALAMLKTSRSRISATPMPSFSVLVALAAIASETNMSAMCLYGSGMEPSPAG